MYDMIEHRTGFEVFKSNVCHRVKDTGDRAFINHILETGVIRHLYNKHWYPESLYLLAMVDYLSRVNNLPLYEEYNELRSVRLAEPIFPASIIARCAVSKSDKPKKDSLNASIPEFIRFNIVESEVRNVF